MYTNCTQHIEISLNGVQAHKQGLNLLGRDGIHVQRFQRRLQAVRHFPHAHGTCQTGTTFEGVQRTQQSAARLQTRRVCTPFTHGRTQCGQQLNGFFFKNGEQIRIDDIQCINVIAAGVVQLQGAGNRGIYCRHFIQRRFYMLYMRLRNHLGARLGLRTGCGHHNTGIHLGIENAL